MRNFIKHDEGTAVFCDKIDGIAVISKLVRPPCNLEIVTLLAFFLLQLNKTRDLSLRAAQ